MSRKKNLLKMLIYILSFTTHISDPEKETRDYYNTKYFHSLVKKEQLVYSITN